LVGKNIFPPQSYIATDISRDRYEETETRDPRISRHALLDSFLEQLWWCAGEHFHDALEDFPINTGFQNGDGRLQDFAQLL
jgi:hypothetical protein